MARSCEAGECGVSCLDGCGCIAVSDHPELCSCYCEPTGEVEVFDRPLAVETPVDVDVADLELVKLGAFLDAHFEGDLMVPAADAYSCVSIQMEGTSFGDVCREVGLEYRTG